MEDLKAQSVEHKSSQTKRVEERNNKAARVRAAQQELERLDSEAGKQELKLRQTSAQTDKAWKWIQENRDKFEAEVFGPPIVTCSVKDPKYTDALEALFQKNDFIAFTVQTLKDFRTLQHQLSTEMRLHEPAIIMCSSTFAEASRRPPALESFDLKSHGFDGWALDYVAGPEKVLAMLCNNARLHISPLGLRDISTDEFEALSKTNLGTWVAGKTKYQIKRRREYNAQTTQTNSIRPAQYWTNQPVDISAKRDLQDNIAGWTEEHDAIVRAIEEAKESFKLLQPKYKEAEEKQVSLDSLVNPSGD
jgi:structural maintenance of chromosomes protein 5